MICVEQTQRGIKMKDKWVFEKRMFKETWIKQLSSDKCMQITDGTVPGLYLRFYPKTRQVSFFLACIIKGLGQRKNLFLGRLTDFENIEDMKSKARSWRQQIIEGTNPLTSQVELVKKQVLKEAEKRPFDLMFDEYMKKYSKMYKKERTIESNWTQYRLYIKDLFGNRYIEDLEEKDILDAYAMWVEKTSFSTANKVLSLVSSFWEWCELYRYLPRGSNPCKYVKKGSNEKYQPTILDLDGYKKLFHWLNKGIAEGSNNHPRLFRAIKVLALTGCRCSEITDLHIEEVALDEKKLHLKDSKTGARDVKLADAAIEEIKIALEESKELQSPYVFPGLKDPSKPISNVVKPFNWALKQAGLPHMRIHDLRHSFITMGANMGENMNALKDAAGHSRLSTTEHYTHLADAETFNAINHITEAICE